MSRTTVMFLGLSLGLSVTLLLAGAKVPVAGAAETPEPLRIGMVGSLFRDIPTPVAQVLIQPLSRIIREQTGLNGQPVLCGEAIDMGLKLKEGKLDLAVFHGVEFAWARQLYPSLRPLVVATNEIGAVRAHVVVNKDAKLASLADLRGKQVGLGWPTKENCRLFLDRHCAQSGQCEPRAYFKQIQSCASVGAALDSVSSGDLPATIVDTLALKDYEGYKPKWHAHLKVIESSAPFPAGVIAYQHGALGEATMNRCRGGLLNAHKTVRGRDMMEVWHITRFEVPGDDYDRALAAALQAFPAPEAPAVTVPTKTTAEPR